MGELVTCIFLTYLILALLIRSFIFLQANKLLKALKAHLKHEARKENENQVGTIFYHPLAKNHI